MANEHNQTKIIAILGSSVALGCYAEECGGGRGWASQLATHQKIRDEGILVTNYSVGGTDTAYWFDRIQKLEQKVWQKGGKKREVALGRPSVVVLSLSLANEGFLWGGKEIEAQNSFKTGILKIVNFLRGVNIPVILGSVYPNDMCLPVHKNILEETHKWMKETNPHTIDFLSATADSKFHWKTGLSCDPGHPNTLGHDMMFSAIDIDTILRIIAET